MPAPPSCYPRMQRGAYLAFISKAIYGRFLVVVPEGNLRVLFACRHRSRKPADCLFLIAIPEQICGC